MEIQIKHRDTKEIIFETNFTPNSVLLTLEKATREKNNLYCADLCSANLRGADLCSADLCSAYLCSADLCSANLRGADLCSADLRGAYLCSADLRGADLRGAYLCSADLRGADLRGADLCSADLRGADLRGADLGDADLCSADLRGADLKKVIGLDLLIAQTRILPDGDLIGWKKCRDGIIVKLCIPSNAQRSHAFGRKCRAEFVDVLEIIGDIKIAFSQYDESTIYKVGDRVRCDHWNEDFTIECGGGIHFFITRLEAENYN